MADLNENKVTPEAKEEKVKEVVEEVKEKAEEKAEEIKEAAEEKVAEAKEAVEEKVAEAKEAVEEKAKEVKAKAEKKVKEAKENTGKKKLGAGALAGIIAAAVVVVAVVVCVVLGVVFKSGAISAYQEAQAAANSGDAETAAAKYEEAYSKISFPLASVFANVSDSNLIKKTYALDVLAVQGKYLEAATVINSGSFTEEELSEIYKTPGLDLTKVGNIAEFGIWNQSGSGEEPLEWIVMEVNPNNKTALLMTKDVIGYSDRGWTRNDSNTTYASSEISAWCNTDFYLAFNSNIDVRGKIAKVRLTTEDSPNGVDSGEEVEAYVFVPSVEDVNKWLADETLAQFVKAEKVSDAAKEAGAKTSYWLRNAGEAAGFASAVTKDGEVTYGNAVSSNNGIRPCIYVFLG